MSGTNKNAGQLNIMIRQSQFTKKIWNAALQSGASDSGDKCYLHSEQKDGVFMVIDDLGRRVSITGVSVETAMNKPVILTIQTFDYNSENKPHLNKPNKKAP